MDNQSIINQSILGNRTTQRVPELRPLSSRDKSFHSRETGGRIGHRFSRRSAYRDPVRPEPTKVLGMLHKRNPPTLPHGSGMVPKSFERCAARLVNLNVFIFKTNIIFVPDDGNIIPVGTQLAILPYEIHRNPKIFPEPEQFNPDRFSEENIAKIPPGWWTPFSYGPRNCIGD